MNYANKLTGLNLKRSFEALVQLTEGARIPDVSFKYPCSLPSA